MFFWIINYNNIQILEAIHKESAYYRKYASVIGFMRELWTFVNLSMSPVWGQGVAGTISSCVADETRGDLGTPLMALP